MYLSLSNLRDANIFFSEITKQIKSRTPLLNYVYFLLLTLERNAYPLFEILRQKYSPSLSRDSSFPQYLHCIAQVFYKVKPQGGGGATNGFGNLFSDIFKNFLAPPGGAEIETEEAD